MAIHDVLDRVKEQPRKVIRPAPRRLVDVYVRTRTWLREIHPRLRADPADCYARRQLGTLIERLQRDLARHVTAGVV
jgi:hypothetical protein